MDFISKIAFTKWRPWALAESMYNCSFIYPLATKLVSKIFISIRCYAQFGIFVVYSLTLDFATKHSLNKFKAIFFTQVFEAIKNHSERESAKVCASLAEKRTTLRDCFHDFFRSTVLISKYWCSLKRSKPVFDK